MPAPLLIIVSGPPCSGKTTLARRLAARFRLPLIYKDGIKETLFDSLGWSDRAWSRKLGLASYDLLFYFVEAQLAAAHSSIVESNFDPHYHTVRFRSLQKRYPFTPFQIQCCCDGDILYRRFVERVSSGTRHPGHVEHVQFDEQRPTLIQGRLETLDLGGICYELDTSDFDAIDYGRLEDAITATATS